MKRNAIALTGGIGSGKSVVGNYLRQRGFAVIDCDKLSREISSDVQVQRQVEQLLGSNYVADGQLDRAKIRKVVFADEQMHKQYSQIFHQRIKEILYERVQNSDGTVFVEIPLLDAFHFDWQQIWLVDRDTQSRIDAVVKRDKVTAQNVRDILSKQQITTYYDVKINNNGSLDHLYCQIDQLLQKYGLC